MIIFAGPAPHVAVDQFDDPAPASQRGLQEGPGEQLQQIKHLEQAEHDEVAELHQLTVHQHQSLEQISVQQQQQQHQQQQFRSSFRLHQ